MALTSGPSPVATLHIYLYLILCGAPRIKTVR